MDTDELVGWIDALLQIYSQWHIDVCLCQHPATLPRNVLQSSVALPGELILKRLCLLIPGLAGTLRNGSGHCATHRDIKLKGVKQASPWSASCMPLSFYGFHQAEKTSLIILTLPLW